jgi:protein Tex
MASTRSTAPRSTPSAIRWSRRMAADLGVPVTDVVGDPVAVRRIDPSRYVGGDVGLPTLNDILAELQKPGRDPREAFEAPRFRDDVNEITDLREGMVLQGTVTNVVAFGAFVDIGVHQDGLVHVSQLADRFVREPAEVVSVGDRVTVRVMNVDIARRRIGLSMRQEGGEAAPADFQSGSRCTYRISGWISKCFPGLIG